MNTTTDASCHCGAVRLTMPLPPDNLTECNCSICRRYGALWAYYSPQDVKITANQDATDIYMWGDRTLQFHRCKTCGCLTHWSKVDPKSDRMGINARLMDPTTVRSLRIRKLDGAVTFTYLR
jgi:hypothetical protein